MNETNPAELERQHVHKVYNKIATHFSNTRYKPWPVIKQFLESRPSASLIADVGCGNGKYLSVAQNAFCVGSDFSDKLVEIAKHSHAGADVLVADALGLPYRDCAFDHAISIAVIHHMSTRERRVQAIRELLRIVKPGGQVLIFVWALEQTETSKRRFEQQDVFVPWKSSASSEDQATTATATTTTYQRYYHVFASGELESLVSEASSGVRIVSAGYDRDNWYVIIEKH